ncbi:hypothetical protein [Maribacter sp.]|uniref:hypothetical protein n=1 Tax=Maribacter sp. TaxID=1897614 RepID=UPI0025BCF2A5|nr:hypothetical protein [Maribacter sp.]|tara:strand:+ start:71 stop:427 length:357 start_codon:yes stop_codon:yes gene_type:complete
MKTIKHNNFVIDISLDEEDSSEPKDSFFSSIEETLPENFNEKMLDYILERVYTFFKNYLISFNNLPPTDLTIYIDSHEDNIWLEEKHFELEVKIASYYSSIYKNQHCIAPLFHFKKTT